MSRDLRHKLEYAAARILLAAVSKLSVRRASNLGARLGDFLWKVLRYRRKVAMANLEKAFGAGKSDAELESVGLRAYRNLGRTLMETFALSGKDPQALLDLVEFDDLKPFERAQEKGKGAVLVTGHFGNWEIYGAALAARGYPIDVLVAEQSNPYVDELVTGVRSALGSRVIPRKRSVRAIVESLRRGRFVAFVGDQDAGKNGLFIDFFDHPASTARGPAVLALRMGCPLLFGVILRQPEGRHLAVIDLEIDPAPGAEQQSEIQRITETFSKALEARIRQRPELYLWSHKRWKSARGG